MKIGKVLAIFCAGLVCCAALLAEEIQVGPQIKAYEKVSGVSGSLSSIGSDTLNNLMTFWAEKFRQLYPNVAIQIEGKGSSTAPSALISGTAQLGPMSRMMKKEEIEKFEQVYAYRPTAVGVALDTLAVFVNKDNPLDALSLQEVDAIFSKNRKGGAGEEIKVWGQLGLKDRFESLPISLFGRNSASGTYGYFKEHALFKGDFKDGVKEQPGSASVVQGVAEDISAIGYSGIGYRTSGVKVLSLSAKKGAPVFAPTYANALSGKYPMSRMLYIYVAKKPGAPLPPMLLEFFRMVLSKEGQEIVIKDGYLPLTPALIEKQLALIK